jgi:ArsR family transcriptional regulator
MDRNIDMFKALGDETRLRAVVALVGGELCVCQFTELFEMAPATVSKHLSILHRAGLIERRKEGRWVYYKLAQIGGRATGEPLDTLLRLIYTLESPELVLDRKNLPRIRRMDLSTLCK